MQKSYLHTSQVTRLLLLIFTGQMSGDPWECFIKQWKNPKHLFTRLHNQSGAGNTALNSKLFYSHYNLDQYSCS
jgi:hypothetical protein